MRRSRKAACCWRGREGRGPRGILLGGGSSGSAEGVGWSVDVEVSGVSRVVCPSSGVAVGRGRSSMGWALSFMLVVARTKSFGVEWDVCGESGEGVVRKTSVPSVEAQVQA